MAKTFAGCLDDVEFLQAVYQFVGSNEDELSFNKSDVIVLTKKDDGGWWEGTLDGKIGWFPNNYCKSIPSEPAESPEEIPEYSESEELSSYHSQVVDNIILTQKKHVEELKGFFEKYLIPFKTSEVLSQQDRETMCGNYSDIVDLHVLLEKKLEEESRKPIPEQRFGKCMLELAPKMKELYLQYCSNHPQVANLIATNGDQLGEYMESIGASSPGIMTLTSFLSKPFLHVEKYGNQMMELERHIQESHIDNLDMKKSTQVLQIIALSCHEVRKKKEMELEMLTGKIDKWEGEPISTLGTLVHMGQVFVEKEEIARRERYFCLFPEDLISLSVSPELVGYCFEERHPVASISAKNVEDSDNFFNGFCLTVSSKNWQVMTSSPREKDAWMQALKKVLGERCIETLALEVKKPSSNLERSDSKRSEVKSLPMLDDRSSLKNPLIPRSFSTGANTTSDKDAHSSTATQQDSNQTPISAVRGSVRQPVRKEWSFTRLRPIPPYQQNSQSKQNEEYVGSSPKPIRRIVSSKKVISSKGSKEDLIDAYARKQSTPMLSTTGGNDQQLLEEDMMILSVIEAYCFSARQRQPLNLHSLPGQHPTFELGGSVINDTNVKRNKLSEKKKSFKKKFAERIAGDSTSEDENLDSRKDRRITKAKVDLRNETKSFTFGRKSKRGKTHVPLVKQVSLGSNESLNESLVSLDKLKSLSGDFKIFKTKSKSSENAPKSSQQKRNSSTRHESKLTSNTGSAVDLLGAIFQPDGRLIARLKPDSEQNHLVAMKSNEHQQGERLDVLSVNESVSKKQETDSLKLTNPGPDAVKSANFESAADLAPVSVKLTSSDQDDTSLDEMNSKIATSSQETAPAIVVCTASPDIILTTKCTSDLTDIPVETILYDLTEENAALIVTSADGNDDVVDASDNRKSISPDGRHNSDEDLLPKRSHSFGKKIFAKGCLCYSADPKN